MGAGMRNYGEVMIYKPEGRSYERTAMEAAVAAGPNSYLASNNLGWVDFQQGDRDRATERFAEALKRHGEGIDAWDGLREMAIGRIDVAAVKSAVERKAKARQLEKPGSAEWLVVAARWEQAGDGADAQRDEPYYREGLSVARTVGDRQKEGTLLLKLGNSFLTRQVYGEALPLLEQALPLLGAVGDRRGEATTLHNIGRVYSDQGEKQKALGYYEQALPLWRAVGDRDEEAATLHSIGSVYADLGEKQKALGYYEQALPLRRAVGDRGGEATTLHEIGKVYADLGGKQKALGHYEQALPLYRAVGDRGGEASTLTNIGVVYAGLGEKRKALGYYEQALPLWRAVGDRGGEAITLNSIGGVYADLGEKHKALGYYEQALPIHRAVGDRGGEAATLQNIGVVYSALGEKQKALGYYEQALLLHTAVADLRGQAAAFNSIGLVYADLGENHKALGYYEKALGLSRVAGERGGEATTLHNIGRVYADLGEQQKALGCFEQSMQAFRAMGDRGGEAITLLNLGSVHSDLRENQKALGYYEQALPLLRAVGERRGEATTLNKVGELYRIEAPRLAIWFAKQAVNILQTLRRDVAGLKAELRQSYDRSIQSDYRQLADLLIDEGRLGEAQQVLDLLKEKEAFDQLRRDKIADEFSRVDLTPRERAVLDEYRKISEPLVTLGNRRANLLAKPQRTSQEEVEITGLTPQLVAAETVVRGYLQRLRADFAPRATEDERAMELTKAVAVQKTLQELGPDTVAVFTLVAEERVVKMLVTAGTRKVYPHRINRKEVNRKVSALRAALENPAQDPTPYLRDLYEVVIGEELRKDLDQLGAKQILWSLDSTLRYVPVIALWDGKQYLGQLYRHSLMTPESRDRLREAVPAEWTGVGFGASRGGGGFGPLPSVPGELDGIFREKAGPQPVIGAKHLDGAFGREALLQPGRRANVVHVASHFDSRPGDASNSQLLLGDGSTLTMLELAAQVGLFQDVNLLTLSACQTGLSNKGDEDGREVDSLANVGQQLGAQAVLASLWNVNDRSTSLFMQEFYRVRQASPGMTKGEALQLTQKAMMDGSLKGNGCGPGRKSPKGDTQTSATSPYACNAGRPYAHPYYWAPFVLMGNWK